MIVQGITGMQQFIPTIMMHSVDSSIFNDSLKTEETRLKINVLGPLADGITESGHPELYPYVARIISMQAFLGKIPFLDLSLSDSGFVVTSNDAVSPASRQRVDALKASLEASLPEMYDDLIHYLATTSRYASWLGSEQYGFLSSAMILTFREYRELLIVTPEASGVPTSWQEFRQLIPKMNRALFNPVARYISREYAKELLEKFRDKEILSSEERELLKMVQQALASYSVNDAKTAEDILSDAVVLMEDNISLFSTYASNKNNVAPVVEYNSPIANFL